MRYFTALFATIMLVGVMTVAAQDKKPPEKIVFPSKQGATTFLHARHLEREKGECTSCHDKVWPQSMAKLDPKNTGCATCHSAKGKAFDAHVKDNCVKCHPADAEKTA